MEEKTSFNGLVETLERDDYRGFSDACQRSVTRAELLAYMGFNEEPDAFSPPTGSESLRIAYIAQHLKGCGTCTKIYRGEREIIDLLAEYAGRSVS